MLSLIHLLGTVAVITSDGRMIVVSIWHIYLCFPGDLLDANFSVKVLPCNA